MDLVRRERGRSEEIRGKPVRSRRGFMSCWNTRIARSQHPMRIPPTKNRKNNWAGFSRSAGPSDPVKDAHYTLFLNERATENGAEFVLLLKRKQFPLVSTTQIQVWPEVVSAETGC